MPTLNELTTKLASKQAQLIEKAAQCAVLRNEIAVVKIELKRAKSAVDNLTTKPKTSKPARKPKAK